MSIPNNDSSKPEVMPLWMQMFQSNVLSAIADVKDDIKDMVTRDTFQEYKTTTARELRELREKNAKLSEDLQSESTARTAAEMAQANKATAEAQSRQRVQSATNWQWVLIIGTVALNYLAQFLPSAGGTP